MWISKKRLQELTKKYRDTDGRLDDLSNQIVYLRTAVKELLLKTAKFEVGGVVSRLYCPITTTSGRSGWEIIGDLATKYEKESGWKVIKVYLQECYGIMRIRYTIIKGTVLLEMDECLLVKEVQNEQRPNI